MPSAKSTAAWSPVDASHESIRASTSALEGEPGSGYRRADWQSRVDDTHRQRVQATCHIGLAG